MSSTSIGTGTPQDRNENPLSDSEPSRTLGAESGPSGERAPGHGLPDTGGAAAPPEVAAPSSAGERPDKQASLAGVVIDPERISQAFPEGPNVAPSPWEDEAARGRS